MNKDKYVIANCPATYKKLRINENNAVYIDEYRCNYNTLNPCQDCTDCVMKQIVEKCKNMKQSAVPTALRVFAYELLQLLDIQEVE